PSPLSLHDALPIYPDRHERVGTDERPRPSHHTGGDDHPPHGQRPQAAGSEEDDQDAHDAPAEAGQELLLTDEFDQRERVHLSSDWELERWTPRWRAIEWRLPLGNIEAA